MQTSEHDNEILWRYLLGELDEESRVDVETRLLLEDDYNDLLLIVEENLLEQYRNDLLSPADRDQFTHYFFNGPGAKQKLWLNQGLETLANHRGRSSTFRFQFGQWLGGSILRPLIYVSGIVIVALSSFFIYRQFQGRDELSKAVADLNTAYADDRPVEARLSGLAYAPFTITLGGEEKDSLAGKKSIARDRAGHILLNMATDSPSPEARRRLGQFYLTQKQYDRAIEHFQEALNFAGSENIRQSALLHSDLGAAYLERAKYGQANASPTSKQDDLTKSKTHLDEALRLVGDLPEALFNLGLLYQEQQLWLQAREAWEKYLKIDRQSKWGQEAERNRQLSDRNSRRVSLDKSEVRKQFLAAYQSGDADLAWRVLSQNREATRERLIWWQLAGEFLAASIRRSEREADFYLRALEFAGKLEEARSHDSFTLDLARIYRGSSPEQRHHLSDAHQLLRQGHQFLLDSHFEKAMDRYRRAEQIFKNHQDPCESAFAGFWKAYCYKNLEKFAVSLSYYQDLLAYTKTHRYSWMRSQVMNMIGSIKIDNGDFSEGITDTEEALEAAREIGDTVGQYDNLILLANSHRYLNNYEESVDDLQQCLKLAESSPIGHRLLWTSYDMYAQSLSSLDYNSAAAEYQREALRLAMESEGSADQRAISHVHMGIIHRRLEDFPQAMKSIQDSIAESRNLPLAANRLMLLAHAQLHLGHLYREQKKLSQAIAIYQESIRNHRKIDFQLRIYEGRKGILLCHLSNQSLSAAETELNRVLRLAETYRHQILREKQRDVFFDAEQNIYDIAVDFYLTVRKDQRKAFQFSEAPRARSLLDLIKSSAHTHGSPGPRTEDFSFSTAHRPLNLPEILQNLPANSQILQYAVLENSIHAWVISREYGVKEARTAVNLREFNDRVMRYLNLLSHPSHNDLPELSAIASEFYQLLLAPVEPYLNKQKRICIVPDKILNYLPFGALRLPGGRPAITEYTFLYSPSSTVFILSSAAAQSKSRNPEKTILAVGNPAFDRKIFRLPYLPWADSEVEQIANFYPERQKFKGPEATERNIRAAMTSADIIHFAAHNLVDPRSPMLSRILLAREETGDPGRVDDDGALMGSEIYASASARTRLVVLSACQSGVGRYYKGEGMIGMARNFLAAGIPLVVASLWPVETEATSHLMIRFHENRKLKGLSTPEALREAQLEMLNGPDAPFQHPAFWAGFIGIGGNTDY